MLGLGTPLRLFSGVYDYQVVHLVILTIAGDGDSLRFVVAEIPFFHSLLFFHFFSSLLVLIFGSLVRRFWFWHSVPHSGPSAPLLSLDFYVPEQCEGGRFVLLGVP